MRVTYAYQVLDFIFQYRNYANLQIKRPHIIKSTFIVYYNETYFNIYFIFEHFTFVLDISKLQKGKFSLHSPLLIMTSGHWYFFPPVVEFVDTKSVIW
jgi:hypothetical protein